MQPETDRRLGKREATRVDGRMVFPDGKIVPVVMIDSSTSGARLEVDPSVSVPHRFVLKLDEDGQEIVSEFIWRKDAHVGIHFLEVQSVRPGANSTPAPAVAPALVAARQSLSDLRDRFGDLEPSQPRRRGLMRRRA